MWKTVEGWDRYKQLSIKKVFFQNHGLKAVTESVNWWAWKWFCYFTAETNVKPLSIFSIFQPCIVAAKKSLEPAFHMEKAKGKNANKQKVNINV